MLQNPPSNVTGKRSISSMTRLAAIWNSKLSPSWRNKTQENVEQRCGFTRREPTTFHFLRVFSMGFGGPKVVGGWTTWLKKICWCSSNWIMKPQGSGLNIKNISIHHPVDDLHRDLGLKWLKPFPWFSQEWFYSSLPWIFNISHLIFIQFSRDCSSLPKWYVLGPTENALGRTTKNRCGNLETHWT